MLKAVLIDVDDTLLDFTLCAKWSMAKAGEQFGLSLPDDLFTPFKKINDGLWMQLEQKELTFEQLYAIRWNLVFDAVGIDFDGPTFEKAFLANMGQSTIRVEGAEELLQYLSKKYAVYVASNSNYTQQSNRMRLAGLHDYFKDYFVSDRIGHSKPTPEFFAACLERTGLRDPEELIMIGDSLRADITGAAAFGIPSCWFNKHHKPNTLGVHPTYTVEYLADIKNFL